MMRVILVGSRSERARLRAQMNGSLTIVGEFPTIDLARDADVDADAIIMQMADPGIADRQLRIADPQSAIRHPQFEEPLTPREVQVLELLAEGLPNKAIAARLGISDQTVKFHVAAISGKLGAANRTDAVRRAVRRGLIMLGGGDRGPEVPPPHFIRSADR
jgi:two-component system, NarL family, nitrate/nitrite response regulator NarL